MSKFQIRDDVKRNNKLNITFKLDIVNNFIIFNIDEINTYLKQFISSYLWKQHTGTPITLEGIFNNQLKISTEFLDVNSSFSLEVILNNGESVRSSPLIITQDILDNFNTDNGLPSECLANTLTVPNIIGTDVEDFSFVYEIGTYGMLEEDYTFNIHIHDIYEVSRDNLSSQFMIAFQSLLNGIFRINTELKQFTGVNISDPDMLLSTHTVVRFLSNSELAERNLPPTLRTNGTDALFGETTVIISCGLLSTESPAA